MQLTVNEWAKYYDNVIWIDDSPWELRNRLLIPMSPPHKIKKIDRKKVKEAISQNNALLAYWTDQWDSQESEWWWNCCDISEYGLEDIQNQSGRRGIKKGLSSCSVKRIKPELFSKLAYPIYHKSLLAYNIPAAKTISFESFNKNILKQSQYDGFELWGAFVDEQLASFAVCLIIENIVSLGSTKSDPEFHKYYSNNALFYHITKHYLTERGYEYITNGPRTILHPTSINDFLARMGYKRVYGRLNVELSTQAKLILNSGMGRAVKNWEFMRRLFPNQISKISGFLKLIEISKTF